MHVELFHPAVRCRMFFLVFFLWGAAVGPTAFAQGAAPSGSRFTDATSSGSRFTSPALSTMRFTIDVTGGYQRLDLHWSIAGNSAGTSPNVYSELKWKGVASVSAGLDISWKAWKDWVVVGAGSRSFTVSGRVSDKDYGADDRRDVIYDQSFVANKGYAYTLLFGLGYQWRVGSRLRLVPVAGYSLSGQRLSITDGGLLDSYYKTRWEGFAGRLSGEWQPGAWALLFGGAYHQINYRAEGDWNLIQNFRHPVSFRHRADGYGLEGQLGIKYTLGRVALLLMGSYAGWSTGKGVDELYLASGQSGQTQLNEVVLSELGIRAGIRIGL
jgi:hypothetical protein